VDGPLAGRLLAGRQLPEGATVSLAGNIMNVAEAEFAFRMARALLSREHRMMWTMSSRLWRHCTGD
jgi:2-keto-4-pentenoate hydratase